MLFISGAAAPFRRPCACRLYAAQAGWIQADSCPRHRGRSRAEMRFFSVTRHCLLWAWGPFFPDGCRDFFLQIASEVAVSAFRDGTRYRSDGDRTRILRIMNPALSIASSETSLWVPLLFDKTPFSFSSKKKGCCCWCLCVSIIPVFGWKIVEKKLRTREFYSKVRNFQAVEKMVFRKKLHK